MKDLKDINYKNEYKMKSKEEVSNKSSKLIELRVRVRRKKMKEKVRSWRIYYIKLSIIKKRKKERIFRRQI